MKKLQKAIIASLSVTALVSVSNRANALDTYVGDLNSSVTSLAGSISPQGWNGTNNGGLGWGHNSSWFRLNVITEGGLDIRVDATTAGVQPAFSVWSSGNSGFDTTIGGAHSYNQVGNAPWVEAGNLLTFVGLANNNLGGCGALSSCGNSHGIGPGPDASVGASVSIGSSGDFNYASLFLSNVAANSWYLIAVGGSGGNSGGFTISATPAAVPLPTAVWLFGSAIVGLVGLTKRRAIA